MDRLILLVAFLFIFSCKNEKPQSVIPKEIAVEETKNVEEISVREGWVSFPENKFQHLDVRYATENNFVNEAMYECGKCFLRTDAALALQKVALSLSQIKHKLILYDCYRPKPVQQKLWDKVPNPSYVTPPHKGSMHNRGVAVDLSIMDEDGNYLNMGTEYDFFGVEAHTDNFNHSEEVLKNRKLLNDLMVKYGFKGIRTEWWHFAFVEGSHAIADWEWECP